MSKRLWLIVLGATSVLLLASGTLAPLHQMVQPLLHADETLLVAACLGAVVFVCCSFLLLLQLTRGGRRVLVNVLVRLGRSVPRIARSLQLSRDAVRSQITAPAGKRGYARREVFAGRRRTRGRSWGTRVWSC
jgi:hypothetical protein